MQVRSALFLVIVSCSVATAQTPALCPWLSTGSAETALGGDVKLTAKSESNWQGSCHFARTSGGSTQMIDIQISKVKMHPCPEGSAKVVALGNEAVQCIRPGLSGVPMNTIAGRMRDAYFEITMTGVPDAVREEPASARPTDPYGATLIERIAEQVVGNLY
jgi:hypothetical protein